MVRSPGLALYRGSTSLLAPWARTFLELRARRGREDRTRIGERLGNATLPRPSGAIVWLHGASVGEGLALLPLIAALRHRGLVTLLTTGTRSSAGVLDGRLPNGALHQGAPLDLPAALETFLDHWRPAMLILAESELWPNMLRACETRMIPVVVVNGRLSQRSHARWRRAPAAARALFGAPRLVLAQNDVHAARFIDLGARDVRLAGNLKHDRAPPPADPEELARLRAAVNMRPVLVAASTHPVDEPIVLHAIARIRENHRDLLTVIVPRDVARGAAIAAMARDAAFTVAQRSEGSVISAQTDILVADTFGEMGLWLRLSSVALIGKTFDGGGQTPIEAAQCGAAIVHGPSVDAFADVFAALDRNDGAICARDGDALADSVTEILTDPTRCRAMVRAAAATVESMRGATERTLAALKPFLPAKPCA